MVSLSLQLANAVWWFYFSKIIELMDTVSILTYIIMCINYTYIYDNVFEQSTGFGILGTNLLTKYQFYW
jgi:hypothetical protein